MLRERRAATSCSAMARKGRRAVAWCTTPADFNDDIITIGATLFARLVEKHCR
ncbi:hypothetical protein LNP74_04010 [Klebsiella pneumoniae subsp. pneumoniae]|nr:hypothetical protein [Klebsiella pneumoniae subsp. pneumoniae]